MGELFNNNVTRGSRRRRSIPSCFDDADVGSSSKVDWSVPATTKKTRWSIDGGGVGGRGVPDIVRVTRYDVDAASTRLEDCRKRRCTDRSSDFAGVPPKRLAPVGGTSWAWNCAGLTWSGLRRRLGVFRRSCRVPSHRRDHRPPAVNTGNRQDNIECAIVGSGQTGLCPSNTSSHTRSLILASVKSAYATSY